LLSRRIKHKDRTGRVTDRNVVADERPAADERISCAEPELVAEEIRLDVSTAIRLMRLRSE
jgi:hypothetical protein